MRDGLFFALIVPVRSTEALVVVGSGPLGMEVAVPFATMWIECNPSEHGVLSVPAAAMYTVLDAMYIVEGTSNSSRTAVRTLEKANGFSALPPGAMDNLTQRFEQAVQFHVWTPAWNY